MNDRPDEAIAKLKYYLRCVQPDLAIVDRRALDEVLAYLMREQSA